MTSFESALPFEKAARAALENTQLRRNMAKATQAIRGKRAAAVRELPDWEDLREAGRAIKEDVLRNLDRYLTQLESAVQRAGGSVHWARDASEANAIVGELVARHRPTEVLKVKSLTTEEIGLNAALAKVGARAIETDLAELIVQLGNDKSSHFLVPAIHKNRSEVRELFRARMGLPSLSDDPRELAGAARAYLREKFLTVPVAVSGANFAVAENGAVCVVESEGNGRMCLTLPRVLITIMGLEKVVPTWRDLEVFLQLLPRSSTAERMNPYTTFWTGATPGDGPQEFHLVLLDNGRTNVLKDPHGRQALYCIRCSACLNVCPVYERTGGHAYNAVYPGPIGAILTPQLLGEGQAPSLPFASSLCGACYEVCPVKINIPEVLVHMRGREVRHKQEHPSPRQLVDGEGTAMKGLARVFGTREGYERAQRFARLAQRPLVKRGVIERLPGPLSGWTIMRDLKPVAPRSFRDWWRETHS